jgi:hypothetical protein
VAQAMCRSARRFVDPSSRGRSDAFEGIPLQRLRLLGTAAAAAGAGAGASSRAAELLPTARPRTEM